MRIGTLMLGLSLLLLPSTTWAFADIQFGAAEGFDIGLVPWGGVVADFDEDGHHDLAVIDRENGQLAVLIGDGNGGFTPSIPIDCGVLPQEVRCGDFNEDAHTDLVVANHGALGDPKITVLFGDGDGGFPVSDSYDFESWTIDLRVDDFNEDDHQDVAVIFEYDHSVWILPGDGTGALGTPVGTHTGKPMHHLTTLDFNDDGHRDLAVTHRGDYPHQWFVSVLLGDGTGSFGSPAFYLMTGGEASHPEPSDFDEDGNVDLAVSHNDGGVTVLFGDGTGGVREMKDIPLEHRTVEGRELAIGDFNGDAHADFAVVMVRAGNSVHVLLGDGAGDFAPSLGFIIGAPLKDVLTADFDEDGHLDLVTLAPEEAQGRLLTGLGNGDFLGIRRSVAPSPTDVVLFDFDEDGDLDLASTAGNKVFLIPGNADGTFGPEYYVTDVGSEPLFLRAADWNGDGWMDLASCNNKIYSDNISVVLNNGAGHFHPSFPVAAGTGVGPFDTADFNGDDIPDLVVPNESSNAVAILDGTGTGEFGPPRLFPTAAAPQFTICGDFNEDGHPDVAVAAAFLCILLGDGAGNLGPATDVVGGVAPVSLGCGDFNEDEHLDLAVGNSGGYVRVFLGDGAAGFAEVQVLDSMYSDSNGFPGIECADLDGDGTLDLVVTSDEPNAVGLFLGDGTGQFVMRQEIPGLRHTRDCGLAVGDVFEDGQADLALATRRFSGTLIVLNHTLGYPDLRQCLRGTVNSGVEPVGNVLLVNGSAGGVARIVEVGEGAPIECVMQVPPAGGNGTYVVHADFDAPGFETVTILPADVGMSCFPFLLTLGATPDAIWNCLGKRQVAGYSTYFDGESIPDPAPAPATFLDLPTGDSTYLPVGTTVTFQGVIRDPGSASHRGGSATNAVIVKIL